LSLRQNATSGGPGGRPSSTPDGLRGGSRNGRAHLAGQHQDDQRSGRLRGVRNQILPDLRQTWPGLRLERDWGGRRSGLGRDLEFCR